jgi:hypothetical protein
MENDPLLFNSYQHACPNPLEGGATFDAVIEEERWYPHRHRFHLSRRTEVIMVGLCVYLVVLVFQGGDGSGNDPMWAQPASFWDFGWWKPTKQNLGNRTKAEYYKEKGAQAKEYWRDYGNMTGADWKKKGEESNAMELLYVLSRPICTPPFAALLESF